MLTMRTEKNNFGKLLKVMRRLRGRGGCPWDRQQQLGDLATYLLEETHETLEAMRERDYRKLREELGDLLYQIVFVCHLAGEKRKFGVTDVIAGICDKLERRHPHVFGNERVSGADEVLRNWEGIKMREKALGPETSLLAGVPKRLPALLKAYRLSSKAARVGFDWKNMADVFEKLSEELEELMGALKAVAVAGTVHRRERQSRERKRAVTLENNPATARPPFDKLRACPDLVEGAGSSRLGFSERPSNGTTSARAARMASSRAAVRDELGDILFVMCNIARKLGIDPEDALQRTNAKFIKRFRHIEHRLHKRGLCCTDVSLDDMERLWQEAKG